MQFHGAINWQHELSITSNIKAKIKISTIIQRLIAESNLIGKKNLGIIYSKLCHAEVTILSWNHCDEHYQKMRLLWYLPLQTPQKLYGLNDYNRQAASIAEPVGDNIFLKMELGFIENIILSCYTSNYKPLHKWIQKRVWHQLE